MEELSFELENCFGIKKMDLDIDFSNNNSAIIYAPNGTMKSSLANTFKCIRDGKKAEDRIFGRDSQCKITIEDGTKLEKDSIIVINPFDEEAFEQQGLLMANPSLRAEYLKIYKSINEKSDELFERMKEKLGYTSRSGFNAKQQMLRDWNSEDDTEFSCLLEIQRAMDNLEMHCSISNDLLNYEKLFNDKVYSMLKTGNTPELLENYEKKYLELMEQSLIMQNGVIDHSNYANISSSLGGNGFFAAHNEIVIRAKDGSFSKTISSQEELDELISAEKEKVLNTKELKDLFTKIEKILSKNKDTQSFASLIQLHPELIVEYKNIDQFKKKVWVVVCLELKAEIQSLLDEYYESQIKLSELVKAAKEEKTDWENALELFKQRFYVPFEIETDNQEDVILKESLPSFKYLFTDEQTKKEVTKDNLLDTLSTGERRAYYILNMIFQILVAKKEGKEKIIVLDDISESFDYRNKYAIIEYINDISDYEQADGNKLFKILLLTHNFDFYRTVASRITKRGNSFIAFFDGEKINFVKGQYIKNIFAYYKTTLVSGSNKDNIIIAAIPFVRNLIEYTEDDKNLDYLLLTSILHSKDDTKSITLGDIQRVFNEHWCKSKALSFAEGREDELIYDVIISEADKITCDERLEIENKIILSMASRLIAEEYMIRKLSELPNGETILEKIKNNNNQSGRLVSAYHKYINDENAAMMDIIAMITPENIHINSFMFEPILDMSMRQLYEVYYRIKNI